MAVDSWVSLGRVLALDDSFCRNPHPVLVSSPMDDTVMMLLDKEDVNLCLGQRPSNAFLITKNCNLDLMTHYPLRGARAFYPDRFLVPR